MEQDKASTSDSKEAQQKSRDVNSEAELLYSARIAD